MPLSFPASPTVGQQSTQNGRNYSWTGYAWELVAASGGGGDDARWDYFKPAAPTGLAGTAGNAQVSLAWTAPSVLTQTPITDYVAQYSSNGSTWTTFNDGTSTGATATITGLTNGTAYTFRVAAVNGIGQGAYSSASSAVTPTAGTPAGALYAWGYDGYGQLGDGEETEGGRDSARVGSANWKAATAGWTQSLAIKSDNTLWGFGGTSNGELGAVYANWANPTPTQIGSSEWLSVSAGFYHAHAIRSDGTLWGWGGVGSGAPVIGDGASTQRNAPVQIGSDTNWASVSSGYSHTLAIKANGTLWAWGGNDFGQLGTGNTNTSSSPVQVGSASWLSVQASSSTSLAIRADGTLWAWGRGDYSLGAGTNGDQSSPVQIGSSTWLFATRSESHALAIRSDGTLWSWGDNGYGQTGTGSSSATPVQVGSATWSRLGRMSRGSRHSLAIKADGTLWAWGRSNWRQLGTGSTSSESTPVQIGTATWQSVALGDNHTLAIQT
jgi:alpha-tubulin suppressor-like RCC1 family protein